MTQSLSEEDRQRIANRSALRKLVDVEDVASAVDFLLGDQSKNMTGSVMTVDAGSTA
jgi:3-oxoacyl-[acyl-carrier protein] reductase